MKRKIIAAIFTGMLTVALFPAIAHAEIENPEDYMGIWYANLCNIFRRKQRTPQCSGIFEPILGNEADGRRKCLHGNVLQ